MFRLKRMLVGLKPGFAQVAFGLVIGSTFAWPEGQGELSAHPENVQQHAATHVSPPSEDIVLIDHRDDQAPNGDEVQTRQAIERSLPYLRQGGESWIAEKGCVSCHRASFMIWSHNEGQKRGFRVDREWLQSKTDWALVSMLADRKEGGGVDTISQMLLGRDRQSPWRRKPPQHFKTVDPYETLFEYLLTRQSEDGSWPPEGQLSTPPELSTNWALLALASRDDKQDDPASELDPVNDLNDEMADQLARIARQNPAQRDLALKYLQQVKPHPTHEGLVLRALVASPANHGDLDALRKRLIDAQLEDGGWPNLPDASSSDAYATGLTLYALARLEGDIDSNVLAKGRQFLIRTQQPTGSWAVSANQVRSGKSSKTLNEVYSYWGTAWATIGLLQSIPIDEPQARRTSTHANRWNSVLSY